MTKAGKAHNAACPLGTMVASELGPELPNVHFLHLRDMVGKISGKELVA